MKAGFAALALAILLTGCSSTAETDSLPEPEKTDSFSIPAESTPGQPLRQNWTLPLEKTEISNRSAEQVTLLAESGDGTAAFYALPGEENRVLLRWEDSLAEFPWKFDVTPRRIPPELWWTVMDDSGEKKLIVCCYVASGTGVSISQLHLVEKNDDGTLTDHTLPHDTTFESLNTLLRVVTVQNRTYAMLGRELVDVTGSFPEDAVPDSLHTGDAAAFLPTGSGYGVQFLAGGWLDGENLLPTVWYAADVHAVITYQEEQFTLSELHLDASYPIGSKE